MLPRMKNIVIKIGEAEIDLGNVQAASLSDVVSMLGLTTEDVTVTEEITIEIEEHSDEEEEEGSANAQ